ncbi:uncharacterized protein LOC110434912 [Sorghum bicolor]|uniref:uncharacterized protein LOC110434912 n=1 Tax=Sorghum bicolor TaxID=4558 RepID=UPI000B426C4B|nr:uncharacterized protein LOC110434912 [Sorghum bicolor]|eukprot:XP_021315548.1 uncharacterized protein LOC110434912 [Sorghum bicolor]
MAVAPALRPYGPASWPLRRCLLARCAFGGRPAAAAASWRQGACSATLRLPACAAAGAHRPWPRPGCDREEGGAERGGRRRRRRRESRAPATGGASEAAACGHASVRRRRKWRILLREQDARYLDDKITRMESWLQVFGRKLKI